MNSLKARVENRKKYASLEILRTLLNKTIKKNTQTVKHCLSNLNSQRPNVIIANLMPTCPWVLH